MTQDEIIEMALESDVKNKFDFNNKYLCDFVCKLTSLVTAKEREAYEHDMEVLMNALWKACGDDAEVVNATIESQGELTRARGEQA